MFSINDQNVAQIMKDTSVHWTHGHHTQPHIFGLRFNRLYIPACSRYFGHVLFSCFPLNFLSNVL